MANSERIDDIIDVQKTSSQISKTIDNIYLLETSLADTIKSAKSLNDELQRAQGFRNIQQSATQAATATTRLQAEQAKLEQQIKKLEITQARLNSELARAEQQQNRAGVSANQLAASNIRLTAAQQRQAVQTQRQGAAAQAALSPFQILTRRLAEADRQAANIGATLGETSQEFLSAAGRANGLREQVQGINRPLGNFRDQVGQYTQGISNYFNKAFSAIRIFANIVPGLGLSGVFLLGFEGIKALSEQLGLFKKNLTETQIAGQDFQEALSGANYKTAVVNITELKENIILAKEGFLDKDRVLKQYNETIGKTTGQVGTLNEAEASLNKNADAYIKFTFLKAAANIALQKSAELAVKAQADALKNPTDEVGYKDVANEFIKAGDKADGFFTKVRKGFNSFAFGGLPIAVIDLFGDKKVAAKQADDRLKLSSATLQKESDQQKSIFEKFQKEAAELAAKNKFNFFEDKPEKAKDRSSEQLSQQLKAIRDAEEQSLIDSRLNLEQRQDAVSKYEIDSLNIIDEAEKKKAITESYAAELRRKILKSGLKDRMALEKEAADTIKKLFDDGAKGQETALGQEIIDFKDAQDTKLVEIETYKADALRGYADLYSKGKINSEQYNQALYDVDSQSAIDRIDLQIQTAQKIIDVRKRDLAFGIGSAKELQKAQDDLAKFQIEKSGLVTKVQVDDANKLIAARKNLHEKEKQLAVEAFNFIQALVDGAYQNQIDRLKEQSDLIDSNSDKQKKALENSLLSTKERADKEKIIDAQSLVAKQALADKEKEIRQKQAEFDRAVSIARVIEGTAVAIVEALQIPVVGIALASVIGALGALQLATIVATPIPKYRTGTNNADGLSIVGDAGPEIVNLPGGRGTFLSPGTDTLMNLPKGTQVIPHAQSMAMLAKPERLQSYGGRPVDMAGVEREQRETNKLLRKKQAPRIIVVNGDKKYQQRRNNHFS